MRNSDEFAEAFRAYWARPTVDGLDALLAEDVVLRQPLGPTTRGLPAGKEAFARIFDAIPDLHGEVDGWVAADDRLFIEFRLLCTLGGQPVAWPVVDRFSLREGMATERVSFFDPTTLLLAVLRHPSTWRAFARTRVSRRERLSARRSA